MRSITRLYCCPDTHGLKELFVPFFLIFQVGINRQPAVTVPGGDLAMSKRTVAMLSNNTAIKYVWSRLVHKFDSMCKRKAFFHHYLAEGMEESVFEDARDDINTLVQDYIEVEK